MTRPSLRASTRSVVVVGGVVPAGRARFAMALVLLLLLVALFVLELQFLGDEVLHADESPRVERAVGDRRLHCAARFVLVLAVAEPAPIGEVEDVGEGAFDAAPARPQADRPEARGV